MTYRIQNSHRRNGRPRSNEPDRSADQFILLSIKRKTDKSSDDITTLKNNLTSLDSTIEQTENELRSFELELQESRKKKEELANSLKDKKNDLSGNEQSLYSEREGLAGMNSKLESLKELEQSQRSSVVENIKMKCQVSDIFDAPAEYETAIEAILGDKLGAAVVEDQGEITRALSVIKEQKTKRSGFITANLSRNAAPGSSVIEGSAALLDHGERSLPSLRRRKPTRGTSPMAIWIGHFAPG